MSKIDEIDVDLGSEVVDDSPPKSSPCTSPHYAGQPPEFRVNNARRRKSLREAGVNSAALNTAIFTAADSTLENYDKSNTGLNTAAPVSQRTRFPVVISRSLARLLDLMWEGAVIWFLMDYLVQLDDLTNAADLIALGVIVILPLILLLDSLLQGVLGNTPGKVLMGVQAVTWRGRQLTLAESAERNFLLWRFVFLCGILPLIPFTVWREWKMVRKGERTRYDNRLHFRVKAANRPYWLGLLVAIAAIAIMVSTVSHLFFGYSPFFGWSTDQWSGIFNSVSGELADFVTDNSTD